jgi:hypothetical protein
MATHPPYSLDPAPSDFFFYLFGLVKSLLMVMESHSRRVVVEWMTKLERCIETNGDYVG